MLRQTTVNTSLLINLILCSCSSKSPWAKTELTSSHTSYCLVERLYTGCLFDLQFFQEGETLKLFLIAHHSPFPHGEITLDGIPLETTRYRGGELIVIHPHSLTLFLSALEEKRDLRLKVGPWEESVSACGFPDWKKRCYKIPALKLEFPSH